MVQVLKAVLVFTIFVLCCTTGGACYGAAGENIAIISTRYGQNQDNFFLPQICGMADAKLQSAINYKMKKKILETGSGVTASSQNVDFEVVFFNGRLLVINVAGERYTPKVSYPQKIDFGIHIDLKTGEVYSLKDIFRVGLDYKSVIKELCRNNEPRYRMLISDGINPPTWDDWTFDQFAANWNGDTVLADADSLRIYCVHNYGASVLNGYRLPYADLIKMNIIDTQSRFWKAIQSGASADIQVIPEVLKVEDFALGSVHLGDISEAVIAAIGEPNLKVCTREGITYKYNDINVTFDEQNRVIRVISNQYGTRRMVLPGAKLAKVIQKYGSNFEKTLSGGNYIYEYRLSPSDGSKYIIRFAVNKGECVEYIDCRIE